MKKEHLISEFDREFFVTELDNIMGQIDALLMSDIVCPRSDASTKLCQAYAKLSTLKVLVKFDDTFTSLSVCADD